MINIHQLIFSPKLNSDLIYILINYFSKLWIILVAMQSVKLKDWKQITSFVPDSCHKKFTGASGLLPLLIELGTLIRIYAYHYLDPASSFT